MPNSNLQSNFKEVLNIDKTPTTIISSNERAVIESVDFQEKTQSIKSRCEQSWLIKRTKKRF